uniref:Glycosyltransferase n=1 Tax=viral metagenome TaxID=1070528 RepID=A0A6C0D7M0_9ZZZZ
MDKFPNKYLEGSSRKKTVKLQKKAIALLCKTPHEEHINFLKQLRNTYDIYFICDQNISNLNLPKINNIHYIYYEDEFVAKKGYRNSLFPMGKKKTDYGLVTSWDKAFYYFCEINTKYSHIWFIEDDIFIPLPQTITNIDKKYSNKYDLLVRSNHKSEDGDIKKWGVGNQRWEQVLNEKYKLPLPWFRSMVCATRVSKRLLSKIKEIANKQDTLVFHEYMLNTLTHMNNLNVKVIDELKMINFRHKNNIKNDYYNWNYDEIIDFTKLYHPMKDMKLQKVYHELIAKKDKIDTS